MSLLFFHIKVQTRQWTCNRYGSVTCNCGAVLRDHNDVIEFNCCNDHMVRDSTTPLRVRIRSKKCLSPGISITKLQSGVVSAVYQVGLTITIISIERFSNDCQKTKTKVITPTNHNRSRQRDEPIKIPSNYM